MNTTPCRFYRAGSINRAALNFEDAEVGSLVRTYTDSDDNNIALILDANGYFVTTLAGLVKVTGRDIQSVGEQIIAQVHRLSEDHVPPINLSQFKKDITNIVTRLCKTGDS